MTDFPADLEAEGAWLVGGDYSRHTMILSAAQRPSNSKHNSGLPLTSAAFI